MPGKKLGKKWVARKGKPVGGVERLLAKATRFKHEVEKKSGKDERWLVGRAKMLGPGLIAGAADDDAGGIATYSIVGATTGFALSWLMFLTTPMLIAVQRTCALLGDVTRKGLATLIREKYGMTMAVFATLVLVIANVATITADLAGLSVAGELLTGIAWYYFTLPLAAILVYVVVYRNFKTIQKMLIYLSLVLLAYLVSGLLSHPDWLALLHDTLIPQIKFTPEFLLAAVGLLGTTITPYLFFWQTATEIEAKRTEKQSKRVDFDIFAGMAYSNIISYFIIVSAGAVLYPRLQLLGSLQNAADPIKFIALALKPAAGDYSFYLFALGLFAASALAIIVLASSTAYVVAETFQWKRGLNKKVKQAKNFYAVLAGSVALGIAVLASGVKPIDAMYYSQVLSGILDPILLLFILKLATDEKLMGQYAITGWTKAIVWFAIIAISFFDLLLLRQVLGV